MLTNVNCNIILLYPALVVFRKIKTAILHDMKLPQITPNHELYLAMDASTSGIGTVFHQCISGDWKPISFSAIIHLLWKQDTACLEVTF